MEKKNHALLQPVINKVLVTVALIISCSQSHAFCFAEAASVYQVNELVLRAIAQHESRMNPGLRLVNSNGSIDFGLMGVNSIHLSPDEPLSRAGMTREMLLDPCTNVMTGAYLLRRKISKFGNTWTAIGAYHSTKDVHNANYQLRIWRTLQGMLRQASLPSELAAVTTE